MNTIFANYSFRFVVLLFCLFATAFGEVRAQQDDFDKRYQEIYTHISAANGKEALRLADSLLSVSKNDDQRMNSHMLLATINHSLGNRALEFKEVLKAQKIAQSVSNPSWEARTSGFLSTLFRHLGLMQESKKHLALAEEANERQRNSPNYLLTKINIGHEKALHALKEEAYEEALEYLKMTKNNILYEESESPRALMIKSTNDQLLGVCYMELGQLDLADSLLRSSLSKIAGEENNLRPYIYRAQATVAIGRGQKDSALFYLNLVEPYVESSDREELRLLFYEASAEYHRLFGDPAEAARYQDLYTIGTEAKEKLAKQITDELVIALSEGNQRYANSLLIAGLVLFILIIVLFALLLYLVRKRKFEKKHYHDLIDYLDSSKANITTLTAFHEDRPNEIRDVMISRETEEGLVKKLNELEAEDFFLDKNMTVTKLANSFGTNQRYVSYMIRKYRGRDFNDYLHHVRVRYLIDQVRSNKNLLDYKLSYLADMAGFSSHSKFSSVFKSVTGLSPSAFIHFTKDEMKKGDR